MSEPVELRIIEGWDRNSGIYREPSIAEWARYGFERGWVDESFAQNAEWIAGSGDEAA